MPNQSASNVLAALKREVTMGVAAAAGAGADQLRLVDSPGLVLGRGEILSGERRKDQIRNIGRLGAKTTGGSYNTELTLGGAMDKLLESTARGTWTPALAPAAVSSTTTANTIVRAAGSWITDGYRRGDIITITGDTTTQNNSIRLRATSVTATVITVAGTAPLTLNATARLITVTRLKKVIAPTTPIYHSYSIEQYDADIDESELYIGTRLTSLALSLRPNAMATAAWTFTGLDRQLIATAQAPYFTNPALTTSLPLVADDSWLRYAGEDVATLTGIDLTFAIAAATEPVIGSVISPDVFMNDLTITGSVTAVRSSLLALTQFDAETEFELHITLREPGTGAVGVFSIFMPRVKVIGIDAPFLGGDASKIETRSIQVGPHGGNTDTDATAFAFFSSAA